MEFTGNLIKKVAEREGDGQNGHWKIASYLLETVEMYPKRMVVDVSDGQTARVAQWDGMIGKNVVIQFDIDAREWQGRWFNSLRAWAIKASHTEENRSTSPQPASQSSGDVDWDKMGAKDGGADAAAPLAVADGEKKVEGEGKQLYWGDKVGKKEDDLPF